METRTCTKCGEAKPVAEFGTTLSRGKRSTRSSCKACHRAYAKQYATINPEKIKQTRARTFQKWYAKNRERAIAYQKQPHVRASLNARRRKGDPRPVFTTDEARRENRLRNMSEWRERHSDYMKAYLSEWRRRHPESKQSRLARIRATRVQPVRVDDIIARDGLACYLCGRQLERREVTLDHVHPLSRGGTHTPRNLRIACRPCNSRKRNKLLSELDWYKGDGN